MAETDDEFKESSDKQLDKGSDVQSQDTQLNSVDILKGNNLSSSQSDSNKNAQQALPGFELTGMEKNSSEIGRGRNKQGDSAASGQSSSTESGQNGSTADSRAAQQAERKQDKTESAGKLKANNSAETGKPPSQTADGNGEGKRSKEDEAATRKGMQAPGPKAENAKDAQLPPGPKEISKDRQQPAVPKEAGGTDIPPAPFPDSKGEGKDLAPPKNSGSDIAPNPPSKEAEKDAKLPAARADLSKDAQPAAEAFGAGKDAKLADAKVPAKDPPEQETEPYTKTKEIASSPNFSDTTATIESTEDGRNTRIKDSNGNYKYVEKDLYGDVSGARIYNDDNKMIGELKDGKFTAIGQDGKPTGPAKEVSGAVLTEKGDLIMKTKDGAAAYWGSGGMTQFNEKNQPVSAVDSNGNTFEYKDYTKNPAGGKREIPTTVSMYNPKTQESMEFRLNEGTTMSGYGKGNPPGDRLPSYTPYNKDGEIMPGNATGSAGFSLQLGPLSGGAALSMPLQKEVSLSVGADGSLGIFRPPTTTLGLSDIFSGSSMPHASMTQHKMDGTTKTKDWNYEAPPFTNTNLPGRVKNERITDRNRSNQTPSQQRIPRAR